MYTQDTVLRLVGRIYDAALNPREWATFATHLAETVNGHSCALWNVDPRHSGFGFSAVARFDPEAMTTFRRDYAHLDPWARALTVNGMWKDGVVGLGEAVVPQSMLHKTQFYNELGRHYGIIGGFGAISMTDSAMLAITMNQVKPGQFGKEEIHLMRELQPHLRRAITLNERLTRLETLQGAAADALDSFPTCVILLDGRGRPHTVNRAASRLLALGDGLRSTRDGLTADHPSETNVLRRLIHAALETTAGRGASAGGEMTLSRRSLKSPLRVVVSPLRRHNDYAEGGFSTSAVVFVQDPDEAPEIDRERLRRLYGLSTAEARVAVMLAEGITVGEIAARLAVSVNTVRTHLKRLLSKTGTRTQAQLVRTILTSLAMLSTRARD